ncbi:MAG: helix-turn-helix transcriptional regulator [Acutalibacteraceae bacterium]|nr:helix-turn-helix transcriptional regulator [Acutalibacteraceae bacterium]
MTQEELAVKFGVTNQSVSKWESAQCCPDISLIPKLADIFDISILRQLDIRVIAKQYFKAPPLVRGRFLCELLCKILYR